jgi:hypothetical protein
VAIGRPGTWSAFGEIAGFDSGVTGDPLLLVWQRHRRGALLFNLGQAEALSSRAFTGTA